MTDHVDEDGSVLHGHDAGHLEGVVQPAVLGPGDELDLGVGLQFCHCNQQGGHGQTGWLDFHNQSFQKNLTG